MYIINIEKRDSKIKARKLRRNGITPCSIYGGGLSEVILIQAAESETMRLLKTKGKGGSVLLKCNDESYHVIIQEIAHNQLMDTIEHIAFLKVREGGYVNSVARVVFKNRDKLQKMVHRLVEEINYKALPEHLVEEVIIDLAKLRPGNRVRTKDLPIWSNENVEVLDDGEKMVVSVEE